MAHEYDVVILGGGTGGYVAAIRASQLGLKTAIVEKDKLGGTCLHQGCIPTKSYLQSAEVYQQIRQAENFGITVEIPTVQFENVLTRKNKIVEQLHQGVQHLMKKGEIDIYYGTGRILGPSIFSPMPGTISVELATGEENIMLLPTNVVIATGSKPRALLELPFNHQTIVDSNDLLQMTQLPQSIAIIGGGVIGVEWASLLQDFGVQVTLIEVGNRLVPNEDHDVSKLLQNQLEAKGVMIYTGYQIDYEQIVDTTVQVQLQISNDTTAKVLTVEKVLVAIGREANINDIGLENTDIQLEHGFIGVNDSYQTKEQHIYAIGDCIGGLQLAHVASKEGIYAIEHIANGRVQTINPLLVPKCIYSSPQVASIGLTEQQASKEYAEIKVGKFPFKGIGKALIKGEHEGFAKVIVDAKSDDVLGVHLIGPHVTELVAQASIAMTLNASNWELTQAIYPHPSLSEIIGEVALAVEGNALHF